MHSSRMRTVRNSSRLLGGSASVHAGIPPPPPPTRHTPLGTHTPCSRPPGTRPPPPPGSRHHFPRADHPCGQTDRCKNITFATSLRTVITHLKSIFPLAIQSCKVKKHRFVTKVSCSDITSSWPPSIFQPTKTIRQTDRQTHTYNTLQITSDNVLCSCKPGIANAIHITFTEGGVKRCRYIACWVNSRLHF